MRPKKIMLDIPDAKTFREHEYEFTPTYWEIRRRMAWAEKNNTDRPLAANTNANANAVNDDNDDVIFVDGIKY